MDERLCSSTHNKDDVKALDKCAPPGRFISFVPNTQDFTFRLPHSHSELYAYYNAHDYRQHPSLLNLLF